MNAPRQAIATGWVDDALAARDASRLTEAVLWCWGSSDSAAKAEFEQVLEVSGAIGVCPTSAPLTQPAARH